MTRFELNKSRLGLFILIFILAACAPIIPGSPVAAATILPNAIQPLPATLTINGETQTSGIGSFCWTHRSNTPTVVSCADMAGLPTVRKPLVSAETPFKATLNLPLDAPPDSLYISVMPAIQEIESSQENVRLWQLADGWSGALPLKNEVETEFQEGPGLYLFQLNARWKEYGDVSYGFLVQVGETIQTPATTSTKVPAAVLLTPAPIHLRLMSPLTRLGKGVVTTIEPSPDGRWLAIATSLGVYLYRVTNQEQIWFQQFDTAPRSLAFRPDGSQLAIGLAGNLLPIVDVHTGKTILKLQGEESIHGAWSPDGNSILTSAGCQQVLVWNAQSGQIMHTVQPAKCNNVEPGIVRAVWSWDGKSIYINSNYGHVSAWDAFTYQPLAGYQANPPEAAFGLDFATSPTQNLFALENGLSIAVLDGTTGKIVKELESKNKATPFNYVTWSPDGRSLLADEHLWNVETGQLLKTFDDFIGLAWLPDGDTLIGLSVSTGSLKAISASSAKVLFTLDGFGPINGYSSSAFWDGDTLLTYNGLYEMRWDPASGQVLEQNATSQPDWVSPDYAPLSPSGQLAASPNNIKDTRSGKELVKLNDNPPQERDKVAWSPDEKRLVSGDSLGLTDTVVWDAQTGKVLLRLALDANGTRPYLGALTWSPDGTWITAGGSLMNPANGFSDGMLVLWNAQTGQQLHLLTSGMKSERIQSLAWSPDGHWLAAGSDSGTLFLWDMELFVPVAVMNAHTGPVVGLSWSADGQLLASNSYDGTVLVWKLP